MTRRYSEAILSGALIVESTKVLKPFALNRPDSTPRLVESLMATKGYFVFPWYANGNFLLEIVYASGFFKRENLECDPGCEQGDSKVLKARGRLIAQSTISHSYPFCWRYSTFPFIRRPINMNLGPGHHSSIVQSPYGSLASNPASTN